MQCDDNARCDYDADLDATACVCNDGFLGDGFKCVRESDIWAGDSARPGCQRPSDCSLGQTCVIVPQRVPGPTSEVEFEFTCLWLDQEDDSSSEESSEEDSSEELVEQGQKIFVKPHYYFPVENMLLNHYAFRLVFHRLKLWRKFRVSVQ